MAPEKRYHIFLGNFGSGKTELALHFAVQAAQAGEPVSLVDLDIVNPYFRASERKDLLAQQGIRLIAPRYATSNVEIITINPEIYSVFAAGRGEVVFDVGGDNIGARALGQYKAYFDRVPPELLQVWLVVNPHRPLSASAERVLTMLAMIEEASRLKINGLINNANLSYETRGADLIPGYQVVREIAQQTGLPVIYTAGEEKSLNEFLALAAEQGLEPEYIGRPLMIQTQMHRDWERFVRYGV